MSAGDKKKKKKHNIYRGGKKTKKTKNVDKKQNRMETFAKP